tara:strand:- start:40 stop:213 length:174 start_codon:yes stop_codon:yes gene_type:complete
MKNKKSLLKFSDKELYEKNRNDLTIGITQRLLEKYRPTQSYSEPGVNKQIQDKINVA